MTSRRNIIIKGNGLPAAMVAAYLGRMLPPEFYQVCCYGQTKSFISEAHLTLCHSDLREFNRLLKIKEVDFIRHCDGVFSVGDRVSDQKGHDYINTYCPYGLSINGVSFMAALQKSGTSGQLSDWEDCNLAAKMARTGKFLPPDPQGRPIIGDYSYGYQINPVKYRELLLKQAETFGVSVSPLSDFSQNQADKAFLIIECDTPDFTGDLIKTEDKQRLNHVHHQVSEDVVKTIFNTQNMKYEMSISSSDYRSVETQIQGNLWEENILFLSKIPDLLSFLGDATRLIQISVERFMNLFPSGTSMDAEREEYNSAMRKIFSRFSDFQSILLASSGFKGQSSEGLSDDAQFKLKLFSARGRLSVLDDDTLFQDHWVSMLLGQGYWPKGLNLMSKSLPDSEIQAFRDNYKQVVEKALSQMPETSAFIQRTCLASESSGHKEGSSDAY